MIEFVGYPDDFLDCVIVKSYNVASDEVVSN